MLSALDKKNALNVRFILCNNLIYDTEFKIFPNMEYKMLWWYNIYLIFYLLYHMQNYQFKIKWDNNLDNNTRIIIKYNDNYNYFSFFF